MSPGRHMSLILDTVLLEYSYFKFVNLIVVKRKTYYYCVRYDASELLIRTKNSILISAFLCSSSKARKIYIIKIWEHWLLPFFVGKFNTGSTAHWKQLLRLYMNWVYIETASSRELPAEQTGQLAGQSSDWPANHLDMYGKITYSQTIGWPFCWLAFVT